MMTERPVDRKSGTEAEKLLRQRVSEGRVRLSKHFRDRLEDRRCSVEDALAAIAKGAVYAEPELDVRTGDWNYRIEGNDLAGRAMKILFCFKPEGIALLITVMN